MLENNNFGLMLVIGSYYENSATMAVDIHINVPVGIIFR
jgi:hypothetical protein